MTTTMVLRSGETSTAPSTNGDSHLSQSTMPSVYMCSMVAANWRATNFGSSTTMSNANLSLGSLSNSYSLDLHGLSSATTSTRSFMAHCKPSQFCSMMALSLVNYPSSMSNRRPMYCLQVPGLNLEVSVPGSDRKPIMINRRRSWILWIFISTLGLIRVHGMGKVRVITGETKLKCLAAGSDFEITIPIGEVR
jgi:hypothetical protein